MFENWYHNGIKFFKDIYDDVTKKVYSNNRLREIKNLPEGDFFKLLHFDTQYTILLENRHYK